ncbi:Heat shock transcription factor, Y-linked [Pteropus alecto]|uniref:Heat shock transcription factor, Y-linked n=1 Tax=Pteropus alecto TaxID=9402 RepID=L5KFA6_PTEAL|nr:Heat shock transcription factor, Y-linked [Pteropus alecto]
MDQHAVLTQLTTFQMHSPGSYTQANGHIVNFIISTTSTSHYIIFPLQRRPFGRMQPSTFPTRYPNLKVNDGPFSTLQPAGNPWIPMTMIAHTSAATLLRSTLQPPLLGEHHPNYKRCINGLPDYEKYQTLKTMLANISKICNHLL